jgi:hypothetical protein
MRGKKTAAIGVDEIPHTKTQRHAPIAYQIGSGCKRLRGIIRNRAPSNPKSLSKSFGAEHCAEIKVASSENPSK